jgi:PilZ domain
LWVSWKFGKYNFTSRVEDFSGGGAFIASHEPVSVGSRLDLHFSLPEGQLRVQAIVRNVREGRGMGVEFVSMGGREFDLILKAVERLLG